MTLELVHAPLAKSDPLLPPVRIPVDRLTLAKRRWRGVAEDGREFGFDLDEPLTDGAVVLQDGSRYVITQKYEPVIEVALGADAAACARLGWLIGNLHFSMEVLGSTVRVADDPALRQLFEREQIAFIAAKRVFHPTGGGNSHGHHHH